jgi:hypothetical protein
MLIGDRLCRAELDGATQGIAAGKTQEDFRRVVW